MFDIEFLSSFFSQSFVCLVLGLIINAKIRLSDINTIHDANNKLRYVL